MAVGVFDDVPQEPGVWLRFVCRRPRECKSVVLATKVLNLL